MAEHIKGDTWSYVGSVSIKDAEGNILPLDNWIISSFLYKKRVSTPIEVFDTSWVDTAEGTFYQKALDTSLWPVGPAYLVVRLTSPENEVISSSSVVVNIKEAV
jgi:hypothetical protein